MSFSNKSERRDGSSYANYVGMKKMASEYNTSCLPMPGKAGRNQVTAHEYVRRVIVPCQNSFFRVDISVSAPEIQGLENRLSERGVRISDPLRENEDRL